MNVLESYSEKWLQNLERKKSRLPYSFVWALLALGVAFCAFGFLDRVWGYYLEGALAIAAAVMLFVVESCWRRIVELKSFLAEYVETERREAMRSGSIDSVSEWVEE